MIEWDQAFRTTSVGKTNSGHWPLLHSGLTLSFVLLFDRSGISLLLSYARLGSTEVNYHFSCLTKSSFILLWDAAKIGAELVWEDAVLLICLLCAGWVTGIWGFSSRVRAHLQSCCWHLTCSIFSHCSEDNALQCFGMILGCHYADWSFQAVFCHIESIFMCYNGASTLDV